jgi:hypothetical protein
MARRRENGDDPIWVCCNSLIYNGAVFNHGETYRESETEAVRRDHPESFLPWPATTGEIRRANAAIMREVLAAAGE